MYAAMFKALKRIFDLTLGPLFVAAIMLAVEVTLGAVSWVLIKLADFLISMLGALIANIPFPEDIDPLDGLSGKSLDLLEVMGMWPALAVYLLLAVACLITRVMTFGIVGRS